MPGLLFYQYKRSIGHLTIEIGISETARLLQIPKSTVFYWKKKVKLIIITF